MLTWYLIFLAPYLEKSFILGSLCIFSSLMTSCYLSILFPTKLLGTLIYFFPTPKFCASSYQSKPACSVSSSSNYEVKFPLSSWICFKAENKMYDENCEEKLFLIFFRNKNIQGTYELCQL